jgi:hypothetical protein
MGLGKTLTMLANISRTRKSAAEFKRQLGYDGERSKLASKATLVVVPSECKC